MEVLLRIILVMSLLFCQMTPISPIVAKVSNNVNGSDNGEADDIKEPSTELVISEDNTEDSKYSAIASNFATLDIEGYCTLNVPQSHFVIDEANCTTTYKQLNYIDNKTRLYMSYLTNMDASADVAGYITKEAAKVDTVTNDKVTESYGNYDWVRIKADHQEDECNVYVYYTLSKDNTSAFWIKAKVDPSSDDQKFSDVMEQMLNTCYVYAVSGTLFQTPNTGVYKDSKKDDKTVANTSDYEANGSDNAVFNSRGGYVIGADISDDWKDLEIILDGVKFSLPSTVKDFTDAGYKLNDASVTSDDDLIVYKTNNKTLTYKNNNGTVIQLTVHNDDANKDHKFKDCQVVSITVDADKFIDRVATNESEVYNDETAASNMTAANAKDKFNHELILPGGITWGVYTDDLRAYYGTCLQTNYTVDTPSLTWKSGNKQMVIRTGAVHEIKYVQLSCLEVDS